MDKLGGLPKNTESYKITTWEFNEQGDVVKEIVIEGERVKMPSLTSETGVQGKEETE